MVWLVALEDFQEREIWIRQTYNCQPVYFGFTLQQFIEYMETIRKKI